MDLKNEKIEGKISRTDSGCCSSIKKEEKVISTCCGTSPDNNIQSVSPYLNFSDRLGALKARLNIDRMNYKITPGLYAVGSPDADSPVLVSANYKMSFDYLRKELVNIDAWILVLDTKGINVWCAAGKGTFGSKEIIRQIKRTNLERIVNHHLLIVPQLGAPGVAAHLVKKSTGFKVMYGPIKASDLPAFLKARLKADVSMRKVQFNILNRFALVPMEFILGYKYIVSLIAIFFLLSGLDKTGYSINSLLTYGPKSVLFLLIAYFSGTIITPLLLPFIPGRAFSLKGFIIGLVVSFLTFFIFSDLSHSGIIEITSWFVIISSISSFFAMNFTGASTYTSLSGVKKEMHKSLPLQIFGFAAGFILWIINGFI